MIVLWLRTLRAAGLGQGERVQRPLHGALLTSFKRALPPLPLPRVHGPHLAGARAAAGGCAAPSPRLCGRGHRAQLGMVSWFVRTFVQLLTEVDRTVRWRGGRFCAEGRDISIIYFSNMSLTTTGIFISPNIMPKMSSPSRAECPSEINGHVSAKCGRRADRCCSYDIMQDPDARQPCCRHVQRRGEIWKP